MADRKWEYHVQSNIDLPPGATHPMMDSRQMADQLNAMDERGWELVTYGQKVWVDGPVQGWWVFRRPYTKARPAT